MEKTLESPLDCKEIQPVHPEGDQPWDFFGRNDAKAETPTLATSCKELTHWKRLWIWEGLGAGGERDDRGGDGWMASLTRWTWVWVNSGSWWWTGRPGELRYMELQRVGHDWETELNYSWLKTLVGGANYWNCISYLRENGMRLVSPNLVITGKLQSKVIIKNFRDTVNAAIISWEMVNPDVISVWG